MNTSTIDVYVYTGFNMNIVQHWSANGQWQPVQLATSSCGAAGKLVGQGLPFLDVGSIIVVVCAKMIWNLYLGMIEGTSYQWYA